jgi:hypothetical protein
MSLDGGGGLTGGEGGGAPGVEWRLTGGGLTWRVGVDRWRTHRRQQSGGGLWVNVHRGARLTGGKAGGWLTGGRLTGAGSGGGAGDGTPMVSISEKLLTTTKFFPGFFGKEIWGTTNRANTQFSL